MEVLKILIKTLLSTSFILSLTTLIFLFSLTKITEYYNLKEIATPLIEKQMNMSEKQKADLLNYLRYRCLNEKEIRIEVGKNLSIDCEEVKKLDEESIISYLAGKIFDEFYFEKYDCDLLKCLENRKFEYLLSFGFHEKILEATKYLIMATIVLGILYFISIEKFENKLLSFGTILILTSLPYFFIDYTSFLIPKDLMSYEIKKVIIEALKESTSFLLYLFIVGTILLLTYFAILLRKKRFIKRKQ